MENKINSTEIKIISNGREKMITSENNYINVIDEEGTSLKIKFNKKGKVRGYYIDNKRTKNIVNIHALKVYLIQGYLFKTLDGDSTFLDIYESLKNMNEQEINYLRDNTIFFPIGSWLLAHKLKDEPFYFETLHKIIETSFFVD
jgi:hypothetical protein